MFAAIQVHPLESAISIVGTVVVAIILLTVFFRILKAFDPKKEEDQRISYQELFKDVDKANVQAGDGKLYENVRILGITDSYQNRTMPWEAGGMLVLERSDGSRVLVQAKQVLAVEIPPSK
jgi:hypothetical protein